MLDLIAMAAKKSGQYRNSRDEGCFKVDPYLTRHKLLRDVRALPFREAM